MFCMFCCAGSDWLEDKHVEKLVKAAMAYVEADPLPPQAWQAAFLLGYLCLEDHPSVVPPLGSKPVRLVRNLVECMRQVPAGSRAWVMVYQAIGAHFGIESSSRPFSKAAATAGLIPLLMRHMTDPSEPAGPLFEPTQSKRQPFLMEALQTMLVLQADEKWEEVLRGDLPEVLKRALEANSHHTNSIGLALLFGALRFETGIPAMRANGILPDLLLRQLQSPDTTVLLIAADTLAQIGRLHIELANDMLDAEAAEKLAAAGIRSSGIHRLESSLAGAMLALCRARRDFKLKNGLLNSSPAPQAAAAASGAVLPVHTQPQWEDTGGSAGSRESQVRSQGPARGPEQQCTPDQERQDLTSFTPQREVEPLNPVPRQPLPPSSEVPLAREGGPENRLRRAAGTRVPRVCAVCGMARAGASRCGNAPGAEQCCTADWLARILPGRPIR
eukprot:jgi/Botrbrau1/15816/Bobra.40_1s0005.1